MKKIIAFATTTVLTLGSVSVALANGTVKAECPRPVHKHHHKHQRHHHRPRHYAPQVPCTPCPSLYSGFFAGVLGGYGWMKGKLKHNDRITATGTGFPTFFSGARSSHVGLDGGEIGLFLGYDHYFCNWVLGLEGTAQWTDLTGRFNTTETGPAVAGTFDGFTAERRARLKSDWSYDIAVRLGRVVYGCSLWYLKAGAQFTHFKLHSRSSITNLTTGAVFGDPDFRNRKHKYRTGFLAGLGVEVPLACHWSVGAEWKWTIYQRIKRSATLANGDFINAKIRPYENQLIAKIIWKQ